MVMIVPVDADVNEAQDVAQKDRERDRSASSDGADGTLSSRTMIVMMMAKTPSLKASSRPLFIADAS
jgi:hypothetical protein